MYQRKKIMPTNASHLSIFFSVINFSKSHFKKLIKHKQSRVLLL